MYKLQEFELNWNSIGTQLEPSGVSVTYSAGHDLDVSSSQNSTALIAEAVKVAKVADVAVVMVGLW